MAILAVSGAQLRLVKPDVSAEIAQPAQEPVAGPMHFGRPDAVLKEAARVRAGFDQAYSPSPKSNPHLQAQTNLPSAIADAITAYRAGGLYDATETGALVDAAKQVGLCA